MLAFIARIALSMALLAGAIGVAVVVLKPEGVGEMVLAVVMGVGVFAVADWAVHCIRYALRLRRVNATA